MEKLLGPLSEQRKKNMDSQSSKNITRFALWQFFSTVAAVLLLGSVWISLSDKNKEEAYNAPLQQALSLISDSQEIIRPSQSLNVEFEKHVQAILTSMTVLVEDKTSLSAALNVRLGELKTDMETVLTEKENGVALWSKLGNINKLLGSKTNSVPAKDFLSALQQWAAVFQGLTGDTPRTWGQIIESHPAWTRVMSSLQTLQDESQSTNSKNAKAAKEILSMLTASAPMTAIEMHSQALEKLLQARSRLEKNLSQPFTAEEVASARPWGWHRLGYPSDPGQGLLIVAGLLLVSLVLGWSGRPRLIGQAKHSENAPTPQTRQDLLAHKEWLGLLLHQREEAESALAHLLEAGNKLGEVMLQSHEPLFQLIWQAQNQSPIETHEQHHLKKALIAQTQLHEEVQRLQEKLINVHLQFCQGTHQDNLMYDLAYLADAFKGLLESTEQIGHLLQKGVQPATNAIERPQPDDQFAERLDAWRTQLREVTRELNEAQTLLEKSLKTVQHEEPRASVFDLDLAR
jgi:hypothetical protein